MTRRIVNVIILVPVAVIVIGLSVANRDAVRLALNPFNPSDGRLSVTAPFFVFLFAALILGILLGSFATWLRQGKYRKRARSEARAAVRWQAEADKHKQASESSSRSVAVH